MRKRKILAWILMLTLASGLAGCGSGDTQSAAAGDDAAAQETADEGALSDREVTAYVGTSIFESSLDPVKGAMSYAYPFTNNALLKVNPESEYVGDLAADWEISEDALTYTFTLRDGVKFSDGSDFDAGDVVFTYETVRDHQANNENVDLTRLDTVTALDDRTVEFKLKECYSPFFDTAAMLQIVPEDSYDSALFDTMPVGTGAWKVVQYDTNQQIILEPNEYYFGEAPAISKVTLVYMDSDAAFAAAQSGQLDVVMVGSSYAKEEVPGMELAALETMDVRNISLPVQEEHTATDASGQEMTVGNNVTSDRAVREALSIGIDRQSIIDNAFNGVGVPAVNFTDNLIWASTDDYEDGRREEAEAILEEAGWLDEDGDGVREKEGLACSFDIYSPGGDQDRYQLAAALAEDAAQLGIQIHVKTAGWDEIVALQAVAGVVWGWGQYSPTVLYSLFESDLYLTGGYDNVVGYDNPQVDVKIDEALSANNQEDAVAAWKEVQRMADADYPYLYLVNIQHCYFVNENLDISTETQVPHPHGHGSPIICNMGDWSWK
ncbi:MAG: ABC transporter substrate-binding protein [Eubacteriales bacterium]|nr:ABC transporter substrate-binding protein [Eubacteriales bacterium]